MGAALVARRRDGQCEVIGLLHRQDGRLDDIGRADDAVRGVAEGQASPADSLGLLTSHSAVTLGFSVLTPAILLLQFRAINGRLDGLKREVKAIQVRLDTTYASDRLAIGVSPHAPYTVEPDAYRRCVEVARERKLPICTHLAESMEESAFLNYQTGPLRELWNTLGTWDDEVPRWPGSPIELLEATGMLDIAPLLAHVNYASDDDVDTLAATEASVVWCPRTHDYFGHPPHRWREMLTRGINVCVGTDSKASSPDLNVLDDLRLVHRQSPEVPVETLWEMVTTRAARGLRRVDVGSIACGMRADLVAFDVRGDEPLREILGSLAKPSIVIINGDRLPPSS